MLEWLSTVASLLASSAASSAFKTINVQLTEANWAQQ
jgi:hypothetical protein